MRNPTTHTQLQHTLNAVAFQLTLAPDSDTDSDLENDLSFIHMLLQKQYLVSRKPTTTHQPNYELHVIQLLPEASFKQLFRTSLPCFLKLLELIQYHPVFHNNSQNAQRHPATQIAVALCRLGSNGNGAALKRLENLFQLGYGTITLYTQRTISAIHSK